MKTTKILSVIALCMLAFTVNAANVAKITVTSTGGGNDVLFLVEDTPFSADYESGSDIEKVMNSGQAYNINLFAVSAGKNLSMVATNSLADLAISFQSNTTETHYTMTFSDVQGTVTLYDAVTKKTVTLANNDTYEFDCDANTTIADRFVINCTTCAPATPGICHQNGRLEFTAYKDASVEIVDYDDNTDVRLNAQAITADYQTIDLTNVDATGKSGQLLVIVTKTVGADQIEEKLVIKK